MKRILIIFLTILITTLKATAIQEHTEPTSKHDCCAHHHHEQEAKVVKEGDYLSIKDCIAIGLNNSPIIQEYAYKLEIARANVSKAKSVYFPELAASAGVLQTYNSDHTVYLRNYREAPNVGVSLTMMIFDFGKNLANIRMEKFFEIAADYEFQDSVCNTVFDIKEHYYKLLKAKAEYETQLMNLKYQEDNIKKISELVKSGKKDKSDLAFANTELYKIQSKVLFKEVAYKNAIEDLNNSMYLKNAPSYNIYETQTFEFKTDILDNFKYLAQKRNGKTYKDETIFSHPKYTYDEAVEIAYKKSPDLKALIAVRDAMDQALLYIKRNYYPEVNIGTGYEFLNSNEVTNNSFSIGANISASINAMRQKFNVKGAVSELKLADTQIQTFKSDLYFAVKQRLNTVDITYKNIPIKKKQLKYASENLKLTADNYYNDKMKQIDFETARELYFQSLDDYINSEYKYNISLIELEKAMHEHMIDFHDDAEHAVECHSKEVGRALSKMIYCNKKHKDSN